MARCPLPMPLPAALVPCRWCSWPGAAAGKGIGSGQRAIDREPEYLPFIRAAITEQAVARWFAHLVHGEVRRYDLPGTHALNFTLQEALGGGGIASVRMDPQGKAYAQMLLDHPVEIPAELAL